MRPVSAKVESKVATYRIETRERISRGDFRAVQSNEPVVREEIQPFENVF